MFKNLQSQSGIVQKQIKNIESTSGISWKIFKNLESKSGILEIISIIWSPNPGFLKCFKKYGVQIRDFWNNFKNSESKSWIFEIFSKIWSTALGFLKFVQQTWSPNLGSLHKSKIGPRLWFFEMVNLLVPKTFVKTTTFKGDANTHWLGLCEIAFADGPPKVWA